MKLWTMLTIFYKVYCSLTLKYIQLTYPNMLNEKYLKTVWISFIRFDWQSYFINSFTQAGSHTYKLFWFYICLKPGDEPYIIKSAGDFGDNIGRQSAT